MDCKVCGQHIRYCPYCGSSLSESLEHHDHLAAMECDGVASCHESSLPETVQMQKEAEIISQGVSKHALSSDQAADAAEVQDADDVVRYYRQFVQQQREQGATEAEIKPQADQLLNLLKQKLQSKLKFSTKSRFGTLQDENHDFVETDIYSIVLKGCSNRESLVYRLDKVLIRDYDAIRWTVEKMPCVAIYKGNVQDMVPVIQTFREERAAITVIPGNLLDYDVQSVEQIFPDFGSLGPKIKSLIKGIPVRLWEGETVYTVVLAHRLDKESGALVITNQGLYFVDKVLETMDYRWLAIPYYRISQVQCKKGGKKGSLIVSYCDDAREEVFYISDPQKLDNANQAIQKAMAEGDQLKIKVSCMNCGLRRLHDVGDFTVGKVCPDCGQPLNVKLMVKKHAGFTDES